MGKSEHRKREVRGIGSVTIIPTLFGPDMHWGIHGRMYLVISTCNLQNFTPSRYEICGFPSVRKFFRWLLEWKMTSTPMIMCAKGRNIFMTSNWPSEELAKRRTEDDFDQHGKWYWVLRGVTFGHLGFWWRPKEEEKMTSTPMVMGTLADRSEKPSHYRTDAGHYITFTLHDITLLLH